MTAAKLYDYTQCPHRVWRDAYGPQDEKIMETNPFVQLLWDRGIAHEEKVVSQLGGFLQAWGRILNINYSSLLFRKNSDRKPIGSTTLVGSKKPGNANVSAALLVEAGRSSRIQ